MKIVINPEIDVGGMLYPFFKRIGLQDWYEPNTNFIRAMNLVQKLIDRWNKPKVKFHDGDMWNLDLTMAKVLYPIITRYIEVGGTINVQDIKDCQEGFFVTSEETSFEEMSDNVLKQIQYAFKNLANDDHFDYFMYVYDNYGMEASIKLEYIQNERIQKGINLFAKYYRSFWL
jgi:hypothetical protein